MAKNSGKGFVLPIIIIVIILIIAAGAFFVLKNSSSPLAGILPTTQRVTEKDFPDVTDPILKKYFVAQANVTAFRSKVNAFENVVNYSETKLNGNNFNYRSWEDKNGKISSELISIGNTTYVKDYSDNKWWKQTIKPTEVKENKQTSESKPVDFKDEYTKDQKLVYKSLGEETCPNVPNLTCYKYEQSDTQSTIWFDKNEYLLRREASGIGNEKMIVDFEYDNISVSVPSPTKDVPEGKNIYEYLNSNISGFSQPPIQIPEQNTNVVPEIPSTQEIPQDSGSLPAEENQ